MKTVEIKKGAKSLIEKHFYSIYSKWVKSDSSLSNGDFVKFLFNGEVIGYGFYEKIGSIGGRIISYISEYDNPDLNELIRWRVNQGYLIRKKIGEKKERGYRLLYGDCDGTPGLITDVFNDTSVIQTTSYGWDRNLSLLADAIVKAGISERVFLKNDQRGRKFFGLPIEKKFLHGEPPPYTYIKEDDLIFKIDFLNGQKTGFYLDQREARKKISSLSLDGAKILDLFSYTGSFSAHALKAGASFSLLVDEDDRALNIAKENLIKNGFEDKFEIIRGRVEKVIDSLLIKKMQFDIVIVDPPAFIPSKNLYEKGIKAYKKLFGNTLRLVKLGGYIYASSCSFHLSSDELLKILQEWINYYGYKSRVIYELSPFNVFPFTRPLDVELRYLKGFLLELE
ncbi:class I SAM-dependent rRNA methyltransferase [Fervidicoccus fontis]|nr:class I SAM-dependent methyltransferase [Fervidicoccus fontis]MBE9391669.1 class I SAM-dependent rRNA methyltransferase [Fervidicoccus fontis]PMB76098.1 MAG: hypothetical protein C0188_00295 [Fervidicoccus fontis]HEW64387.1 class I SAM-dependent rRNA methyltransferase [Fervidicoccus fontis]